MVPGRVIWAAAALTGAVYLTMLLWSLPRLAAMAGGLPPFDLRPLGYAPDEARALLSALGTEGRAFYLGVQHRLDMVYPGLQALMLILLFRRLAPGWPGQALTVVALAGAAFDWAENAAVAGLLRAASPTDAALVHASRMTQAKSGLVTLAMLALVALAIRAGLRHWRG